MIAGGACAGKRDLLSRHITVTSSSVQEEEIKPTNTVPILVLLLLRYVRNVALATPFSVT